MPEIETTYGNFSLGVPIKLSNGKVDFPPDPMTNGSAKMVYSRCALCTAASQRRFGGSTPETSEIADAPKNLNVFVSLHLLQCGLLDRIR
jgi:hypothetical protein